MNINPIRNKIIVQREEAPETTAGGIILQGQEESDFCRVIAVGSDVTEVKNGDLIIIGKYGGTEFKYEAGQYLHLVIDDIVGVINEG